MYCLSTQYLSLYIIRKGCHINSGQVYKLGQSQVCEYECDMNFIIV